MGKMTCDYIGTYWLDHLDRAEIEAIPDSVIDEMLHAEADVIEAAQKKTGMEYGVHRTGVTLGSIKRGKVTRRYNYPCIYVGPQGKNAKGTPNSEVAFINEFGKHGQVPRPFIRDANEESAEEAAQAAERVYDGWLASKGF